jgi:hypothetical protein
MDVTVHKKRGGVTTVRIEARIQEAIVLRDAVEVYAQSHGDSEGGEEIAVWEEDITEAIHRALDRVGAEG